VSRSLALALAFLGAPATAQEPPPAQVWRVATKDSPPFAFQDDEGRWHGIAVDLGEAIARELGVQLVPADTVEAMLASLDAGAADAALAAITVTPERETRYDFSHPYFVTSLGVAVRATGARTGLARLARGLVSKEFLQLLALMLVLVVGCGIVFYALERKRHPQFREGTKRQALGTGVWWSTIILFGHKGIFPKSLAGSLVVAAGMLASILALSILTGAIASALTLSGLETPIRSVADLRPLRAVTVPSTSAARFLLESRVAFTPVESPRAGLAAVDADEADALVYDAPLLDHLVTRSFPQLRVLDEGFEEQDYAIAFPLGSAWRKPVNRVLLEVRASAEWDDVLFRYLGR